MQDVERFRKRAIFQHWWIVACSLLLGLTGLFLFLSWVSPAAWWGWSRLVHRIAAVGFVGIPVIYFILNPKSTLEWLKEAFTWNKEDLGWLQAAPSYYFGGPEEDMPPQDRSNTGQKLWMLVVVITSVVFVITGFIMWFFQGSIPQGAYQAMVLLHDIAFIAGGTMLLVHIALAAFHPRMSEAMRSMTTGKATVDYVKTHHGKWYERIAAEK